MVRDTHWDAGIEHDTCPIEDESGPRAILAGLGKTDAPRLLHELRNILAGLKLDVSLLAEDIEARGEARQRILAYTDELQETIRLTRRLAHTLGQSAVSEEWVNANEVLEGIGEMVQRTTPFDVQLALQARIWPVHTNPGLLHRALVDRVTDAQENMPPGGLLFLASHNVTLSQIGVAEISSSMPPGDYVRLSVAQPLPVHARNDHTEVSTPGRGEGRTEDTTSLNEALDGMGAHSHVRRGRKTTFEIYLQAVRQPANVTCSANATRHPRRPTRQ